MTRPMPRRAFTLLEVVLAVTLSLGLMVALFSFYKQAADIRTIVGEQAEIVGAERAMMDLLTLELRSALVNRLAGLGMEGGLEQLRFATSTLPGADVWAVRNVTDTRVPMPQFDVQIVGYRLGVAQDDQGQPYITGIERTCQRSVTARTAEEGKEIQVTLLTPRLKFLYLRYWDGNAWIDAWGGGDLPGAVEVILGEQPLPEGGDPSQYAYPTFHRVIYLPGGAKAGGAGTAVAATGEEAAP
jgi:hypothetical protein